MAETTCCPACSLVVSVLNAPGSTVRCPHCCHEWTWQPGANRCICGRLCAGEYCSDCQEVMDYVHEDR